MKIWTRAELSAPDPRRYIYVPLPLKGGFVRIQSLYNSESRAMRHAMINSKGEINNKLFQKYNELVVANHLVDEDGNRMYSNEDAFGDAMDWFNTGDIAVVLSYAKKHSGLNADEDFKAIEDAVKNSGSTAGNSDCGESPNGSDSVACMSS